MFQKLLGSLNFHSVNYTAKGSLYLSNREKDSQFFEKYNLEKIILELRVDDK
jgi:hypothetical protein